MPTKSLVLELQQKALDPETAISDLLRTALVVASKLRVDEMEQWIRAELEGYWECEDQELVPSYRMLRGVVKYRDRFGRHIPIIFESAEESEVFSKRADASSIAELEHEQDETRKKKGGITWAIPFPDSVASQMIKSNPGIESPPMLVVSSSSAAKILDAVRTTVLEWAIQLEKDGILGEGLAFSENDRQAASQASYNVNQFFGPVTGAAFAVGASSSADSTVNASPDPKAVLEFVAAVRDLLKEHDVEDDTAAELESELVTLESQANLPRPKWEVIKGTLGSARRVLERVLGTVAAAEVIRRFPELFS